MHTNNGIRTHGLHVHCIWFDLILFFVSNSHCLRKFWKFRHVNNHLNQNERHWRIVDGNKHRQFVICCYWQWWNINDSARMRMCLKWSIYYNLSICFAFVMSFDIHKSFAFSSDIIFKFSIVCPLWHIFYIAFLLENLSVTLKAGQFNVDNTHSPFFTESLSKNLS